jgi:hypothetical protein
MQRVRWRRHRNAAIARTLGIAAVAALALAAAAAAGVAATNRVTVAPKNTQPPVISGTTQVGKDLTSTTGNWSGTTPLSFSYQWRRCDETGGSCADISGATDKTYTLKSADNGTTLRVVVAAKNADGSDNETSVPTAVVTAAEAPKPPSNNGCPANKSTAPAPIAELSPPARLQITAFKVTTGPINKDTQSFSLRVQIGSTCGVAIQGASVYVTAVPYNQFSIPTEPLTGADGSATLSFNRLSGFPASSRQQQLTLFIRATKPGEDPLAGVSTRRLVAVNFSS